MLSLKQLEDVCMVYKQNYKRCRYLAQDDHDPTKWHCLKKSSKKSDVDDEVDESLKELKKKGQDPRKQGVPLGDNCDGYPILKNHEQGYDKD
jgi:hypothetical protein